MSDNEDPTDHDRLAEAWMPATAPSGFADKVVASWETERTPSADRQGRGPWVVLAALVLAALALPALWQNDTKASRGALSANQRTTLDIGGRATVVAENNTELDWVVDADGSARVQQDAGSVFYRVEPGAPFKVSTPSGTVRVTGTCFKVEMNPMNPTNPMLKGAALGGAIAAALVVTVYEGRVVLADESGSVELGAGERGTTAGKSGPRRLDGPEVSRDDTPLSDLSKQSPDKLAARVRLQARELERLRAKEADLRAELEERRESGGAEALTGQARVEHCAQANRNEPGCSPFFDPDDEVLVEMARCGVVRSDSPSFLMGLDVPADLGGKWASHVDLTDAESTALRSTAEAFRTDFESRVREIYIEAGGDPDMAEEGNLRALRAMSEGLFEEGELGEARRRLSKERAGLVDQMPTEDMATADRYVRATANVGNDFEAAVGKALGADRARELRGAKDGWPGGTSIYSGNCEE